MEELLLAPRTGGLQLAEEFFTTLRKYELRQVCVQRASEASEPKSRPLCMHSTYRRALELDALPLASLWTTCATTALLTCNPGYLQSVTALAPPVAILSTVPCYPIAAQLGRVGRGCRLRTAFVDAEEVHAQAQSYGSFKLPSPATTRPDSLAAHSTTFMSSIEPSPPRAVGRGDFGATSSLLELGSPSDFKEKCQEVQDRINRLLF
jgi:hypothetical protein